MQPDPKNIAYAKLMARLTNDVAREIRVWEELKERGQKQQWQRINRLQRRMNREMKRERG